MVEAREQYIASKGARSRRVNPRAAQIHAKNTGQKVQMMKKGGTKKPVLKYNKGGKKKNKKC